MAEHIDPRAIKRSLPEDLEGQLDDIPRKSARTTVPPDDLDDNQKRWLVIGIMLINILTPVLRKYIEQIVTKLCYRLTLSNHIDVQTFPSYLRSYPPTNTCYLNYEAINNNRGNFGRKKKHYDYKVLNPVDLSKLFLQTHMARYTAFDETCDTSALLGIIINIDKFPGVVRTDAEDVRSKIRNEWAHCNFLVWDAAKFTSSYHLMEKFIKSLSIDKGQENSTLGDLNKWYYDGQNFLKGTTLGLELVGDRIHQIELLAKSLKVLACNTGENFENLKAELRKVTSELGEVQQRCQCYDSHELEIKCWEEKDQTFAETGVVKDIIQCLETQHILLITGASGIGKSSTAKHIALLLRNQKGYIIIPCEKPNDMKNCYRKNEYQKLFVIDDICGKYTVDINKIESWEKTEEQVKLWIKAGKTKIIATCRSDVYNEAKFQQFFSIFTSNVCDLSVLYTINDKLDIAKKYLDETDTEMVKNWLKDSKSVEGRIEFSPLMCCLYKRNTDFNIIEFMNSPYEYYCNYWDKLRHIDKQKYFVLFVCVLYNGSIAEQLFDTENEPNEAERNDQEAKLSYVAELCGLLPHQSRPELREKIESCLGTYFTKKLNCRNDYTVIHDKMFDFLCCYFGTRMTSAVIRYADEKIIRERTQLKSLKEEKKELTIMIPEEHEKEYFLRLENDLKNGNVYNTFGNKQMNFAKYRSKFLDVLQNLDSTSVRNLTLESPGFEFSCSEGFETIVSFFISKGADVNVINDLGRTPLFGACMGGHVNIVQLLIDEGADVNITDYTGFTPLYEACYGGNVKIVQLLIDKGAAVNITNDYDRAPLCGACDGGHVQIVQLLIDKGTDVNRGSGDDDMTALHIACEKERTDIVRLLIDNGANLNIRDRDYGTPLMLACHHGSYEIVQLLICRVTDVNDAYDDPLFIACEMGHHKIVQLLISKGANVNKTDDISRTPLHEACQKGDNNIAQLLIEKGADINVADDQGETPLFDAVQWGHHKIVQLLISKEANVNKADIFSRTPLHEACKEGYDDTAQLLIEKGADVNVDAANKETPLFDAVRWGHHKIVQLLISKGANVNKTDDFSRTPLHEACEKGYDNIAQLLIEKGADINVADEHGKTPLFNAVQRGHHKIVQLLISKEANVNKANIFSKTPLHVACKEGYDNIAKLLIEKGADVNVAAENGETPLSFACRKGHHKTVQLLKSKGATQ